MPTSILLAHLSDIHFRHEVGGDVWDLDGDLRLELERDLARVVAEEGPLRAVLVTGDIAFSGAQNEYDLAATWLAKITGIAGCRENDVWMVPGNHDVDWTVVSDSPTIRDFHAKLRSCRPEEIDENLQRYLVTDSAGGQAQLAPLANYVSFATRYECAIDPTHPFWTGEMAIGDSGYLVKMRGISTPLISDNLDDSDGNRMVMGSIQATIPREPGMLTVTLAHHPPSWLRDGDHVQELLAPRARLQLWGHQHVQRARTMDGNLHVFTGAVHPQRNELEWEPRYNIIRISVTEGEAVATLTLDGRVWSRQDGRFGPDFDADGGRYLTHTVALEPRPATTAALEHPVEVPADNQPQRDARRSLAFRFSSLPYQRRLSIARELNLLDPATSGIKDQRLFEVVLSRAVEENQLANLWDAVQREKGGQVEPNPFADNGGVPRDR